MQEMLTGWGMWLETIEISDVQIVSGSLFRNLQTEFREKLRLHADEIQRSTQNTIREEDMKRNNEFTQESTEKNNEFATTKMQTDSQMDKFRMTTKIEKQAQVQATNDARFKTDELKNKQSFDIQDK